MLRHPRPPRRALTRGSSAHTPARTEVAGATGAANRAGDAAPTLGRRRRHRRVPLHHVLVATPLSLSITSLGHGRFSLLRIPRSVWSLLFRATSSS